MKKAEKIMETIYDVADVIDDIFDMAIEGMKCVFLAEMVIGIPIIVIFGILYRIPKFVDFIYDDLGTAKISIQTADLYNEELYDWSVKQQWCWALSQILYGDYYTAKDRAILEQCLAEKRGEHLETITVYGSGNKVFKFSAYDMGKPEEEYEWHNGESFVSLPITSSIEDVKTDAYYGVTESDAFCYVTDKAYQYTSREIDEVCVDLDLIIYDGIVKPNKKELDVDVEYIKGDSVALVKSLIG